MVSERLDLYSRFGTFHIENVMEVLVSTVACAYSRCMRFSVASRVLGSVVGAALLSACAHGATKVHVISLGKWITVGVSSGTDAPPQSLKVRPLLVDGRLREYVLGAVHEVTERLFVVHRVFRVNDSLPEESVARWQWQRGGWMLVDRVSGRVSAINLPEFDPSYSAASWYRDYAAYCGISDDGSKTYAVVAQLSRRKPVLKKSISNDPLPADAAPESACPAPSWQRSPVRVSFEAAGSAKQVFAIRGRVVDLVNDAEDEGEASK
jgi:hypothetical protein